MALYNIEFQDGILAIGFGDEAGSNDQIVREAKEKAQMLKEQVQGTEYLRINGPASLPVAMALAHQFSHVVQAIGAFDPKLGKYVTAISHSPRYREGDLVD